MAGTAGAFEDEDSGRLITDINVTPLVDIVLVLLIIFMVTTTYIVNPSIKVDLPRAETGSEQAKTNLALTLGKDGALFLNGERSSEEAVRRFISAELPKNPDLQAIIAADKVVPHGSVMGMIDLVKKSGIRKFAMSVEAGPPGLSPVGGTATPPMPPQGP